MNLTTTHSLRNWDDFLSSFNHSFTKVPAKKDRLSTSWVPSVNITEDEASFKISAELPEVEKKDVKVAIDKNVLTISGERHSKKTDDKAHRIESYYGAFSRSFSLPENIDDSNILAESKNGMLYLSIPKVVPKQQLKQIEIH